MLTDSQLASLADNPIIRAFLTERLDEAIAGLIGRVPDQEGWEQRTLQLTREAHVLQTLLDDMEEAGRAAIQRLQEQKQRPPE